METYIKILLMIGFGMIGIGIIKAILGKTKLKTNICQAMIDIEVSKKKMNPIMISDSFDKNAKNKLIGLLNKYSFEKEDVIKLSSDCLNYKNSKGLNGGQYVIRRESILNKYNIKTGFSGIEATSIYYIFENLPLITDETFPEYYNLTNEYQLLNEKKKKINQRLKQADELGLVLSEIKELKILDISDFKKQIIENEKLVIDKGGDNQLFSFMKIDSFLGDFRERIVNDQAGLNDILDIDWLKSRIREETQRTDLDKIIENLNDASATLEGRRTKGFDSSVDKLFDLGKVMKPAMENQIQTMEYYKNMAAAMLVFYLNDKKIRYFEIYQAFERLGVFDSTWQKNVLNKLDNIEIRLAQISNQLTELNQNFISLVQSSENVVSELKEINSSIMTNNMLQAITAYQTWKINKNTKSLRS